tara:strand:+ start:3905 stop:4282 length:378 start_codon:yes stop_codon:yes gene_type:complete
MSESWEKVQESISESMEVFKEGISEKVRKEILFIDTYESIAGFKGKAIAYKDHAKNGLVVKYSLYNPYQAGNEVKVADFLISDEQLINSSIRSLISEKLGGDIASYLLSSFERVVDDNDVMRNYE